MPAPQRVGGDAEQTGDAKPRPARALVYLRVSTLAQQRDSRSLDQQLDEAKSYARRKGYSFHPDHDVYKDVISGARTDRVDYYKLLARVEKGDSDVVVAWNVSRIGRNNLDGAWLMAKCKEHGQRIETVQEGLDYTADPASEFMYDILCAVAKFQRNTILADMMRGKRAAAKRGNWASGRPAYGYRLTGNRGRRVLTPDEPAATHVRWIYETYAQGGADATLGSIARSMRVRDASQKWSAQSVARILSNPVYRGDLAWGGDITRGQHEALITEDVWELVEARRRERARQHPGRPGGARGTSGG